MKYAIVMQQGLILLRVPKRRQTLGAQKNQRHAPCPQKSNRTAVGSSRQSTFFKFSQDVDARDIGTKQSFVASPGHDGQRASAFSNSEASSFETHRLTMLLRMRSQNVMVRSAKRIV